jgi:hypothetical protein
VVEGAGEQQSIESNDFDRWDSVKQLFCAHPQTDPEVAEVVAAIWRIALTAGESGADRVSSDVGEVNGIPFLNGGLFEPLAGYDWEKTKITLPNSLFTNQTRTAAGDVQVMSAGSGIRHSEHNLEDETTTLFQIWIIPERQGIEPSYEQKHFDAGERSAGLRLIASPTGEAGSVTVHQDVRIHAALLDDGAAAGLVAAGLHDNPVPVADFVTSTTHKTLRGPRGGIAMCRTENAKALDRSVFPGTQGGPLMHVIAGKAVAFGEALKPEFKRYGQNVVDNARTLAAALASGGVKLVSGGTDNHLMLVDVTPLGIGGKLAEETLDRCGITCNKNMIPYDERKPMDP